MDKLTGNNRSRPSVRGAASFTKFMDVLQAIADEPGRLDIPKLTKIVPYPRATLHRIITALLAEGLIAETLDSRNYQLGHRLVHLASKSWETSDLRSVARDHIEALRNLTGETVHLAVPSGNGMVYIDKLESPRTVRMTSRIGTRVELYCTAVGKAYLAGLSDEEYQNRVKALTFQPRTPNTFTTSDALYADICKTRERGYSCDNEENEPDIRCFGGVIYNRSRQPVGAVSLSIPIYRYEEEQAKFLVERVKETVKAICSSLATLV